VKTAIRAAPLLLLLVLYWPGLNAWFFQDDFGWLNLRHDVESPRDLPAALFAPKAHGNMRPLGENLYWLALGSLFGVDPLPFHICAFITQMASLMLLGSVVQRMTGSYPAGVAAQILWIANCGLAPAMGWISIYNHVLSGFFFLLPLYFLVRYAESRRRLFWVAHWVAFVLGLGALETNVMYPAVAAVYAALFARPLFRKVLPLFLVAGLWTGVHFWFAPPAHDSVYTPQFDVRLFTSFWTYWIWVLGPVRLAAVTAMPAALTAFLTGLLTAGAAASILWSLRLRSYLGLFGFAWFAIVLLPYLPLPEHKSDYYLAVPAIGVAMLGAWAIEAARRSGIALKVLTSGAIISYLGTSVPAARAISNWQFDRGERVRALVLGVEQIHRSGPEKIILLDGIDTDLFWSAIADLPFRALEIPGVYLAPGSETAIQAAPELLSKYTLPPALARAVLEGNSGVVYRLDGGVLRNATGSYKRMASVRWKEETPQFVNVGDPVFSRFLGQGWDEAAAGTRLMSGAGTLYIGGPRRSGECLYLGVFRTREFTLRVRVNGREVPAERVRKDNDLSELRAILPGEAAGWKRMEVSLWSDASPPLLFGYAEVR
jgi:hypothetical protein